MNPVRQILSYLRPYRRDAILAPLLMILEVMMDLTLPYLMVRIIDVGIGTRNMDVLLQTGPLMALIPFVGALGGIGCTFFAVRVAMRYGADLRGAVYRKVQSLSFGNLDRLGTGNLVTRITNDVTQMQDLVAMALRMFVRAPFMVIGSLIMAVLTSPRLAPLLVILVPVLTVVLAFVIRRSWPLFFKVQASLDRLNSYLQENLAGVRVVKAFVRGEYEKARFGTANEALRANSVQAMQFSALMGPFMMMLLNFGIAAAIWFGGVQVDRGAMTVGEIVAFTNYLRQLLFSLMGVSMMLIQISRAGASASRIAEVLDSQPDVQDRVPKLAMISGTEHVPAQTASLTAEPLTPQAPARRNGARPEPSGVPTAATMGRVTFEHVSFAYDGGEPVLQDISFAAESGQTVAILGATGSGKSSLVGLIPRFYDVTAGRVTVGGADVRDLPQAELRRHIGIVLQDTVLFSGTIADNIHQGRPQATEAELQAAAAAAQAAEFITSFPDGYLTELGQRGVNLSGGQKQRVAIARALVRQPEILILDDSTSSVDVETEAKLQAALESIMAGRTSFVVAQRISTVLRADKILVLDDGRLVAEGPHSELLAGSPIYREIYESQLGQGILAVRQSVFANRGGNSVTAQEVAHGGAE